MKKIVLHYAHVSALGAMSSAGAYNTATDDSERIYGDGTNSSIGPQINKAFYKKKALQEAQKKKFFSQLASVEDMPRV